MPLAVLLNPDDPLYEFEHMMQHREYFAVIKELYRLDILPYLLDPNFGEEIPVGTWQLRHQQAHDDLNRNLPSNYANGYSISVITPPAATGTGNSTGTTSVAITGVTNKILIGATVTGAGVPSGTTILTQQSGPQGGDGTYTISSVTTLSNVPLTMTHAPYNQANPLTAGVLGIPQSQILIEGDGPTPEERSWWTFINHEEHYLANAAILPLPTTAPTTAGTPPGQATVSNPWWWAQIAPVIFPYW